VQQGLGAAGLARLGKSSRSWRILKLLKLFRVVRFAKVITVLSSLSVYIKSDLIRTLLGLGFMVLSIVLTNHYFACGWYAIGRVGIEPNWLDFFQVQGNTTTYQYLTSLHWSLTQFTPAGMEIYARNHNERVYSILVLLFALITFSSFVSSITRAMAHLGSLRSEPERQEALLRNYFEDNNISAELCQRILKYLYINHWSVKKRLHEQDIDILAIIPDTLRSKLREELFLPALLVSPFFVRYSTMNMPGMKAICDAAVSEVSLMLMDELFTSGKVADSMYILAVGTMEYVHGDFTPDLGRIIQEGQWVCEQALWMKWTHCGKLIARKTCEVFVVNASRFRTVVLAHDHSLDFVINYANCFVEYIADESHVEWMTDIWTDVKEHEELVRCASWDEPEADFTRHKHSSFF